MLVYFSFISVCVLISLGNSVIFVVVFTFREQLRGAL